LSNEEKKTFFDGMEKRANTMHMYMDTTKDAIHVTVSLPIVDIIIQELFYRHEDQIRAGIEDEDDDVEDVDKEDHAKDLERQRKREEKKIATKRNAMKIFKLNNSETMYDVVIPNKTRFMLAIHHVGIGMSFRQTAAAIRHAKEVLKAPKLAVKRSHRWPVCTRPSILKSAEDRRPIGAPGHLGVLVRRGRQHSSWKLVVRHAHPRLRPPRLVQFAPGRHPDVQPTLCREHFRPDRAIP
jgi:hypothetical protein